MFIINDDDVPSVATWIRLGDCPTVPCDTDSPPVVTDLQADVIMSNSVYLVWTAPGDSPDTPTGEYDLRFSTVGLASENDYAAAMLATGEDPVGDFGVPRACDVTGLTACMQYHFALKTRDGAGPPYKNWSPLSNTVTVSTFCGWGGGGGGYSARRVDGRGEGGGSLASGTQSIPDQAIDAGALVAAGGDRGAAGPAMTTSLDAGTGVIEVETRRTSEGGWEVTLRRLAQTEGVEAADAEAIVSQLPDGSRGWKTLGRFRPTAREGQLGLCALRDQGRIVLPPGYALARVASGMRVGGQDLTLDLASHSRLGSLRDALADGGGGVEMAIGDALTLEYSPSGSTLPEVTSWYVVARPADGSESAATPVRLAPATEVPRRFALHQNHPNPSRRTATIAFDLPVAVPVTLEVFDLLGRKVTTLAEGEHPAGVHTVEYDLREAGGTPLRAGVYVYRLRAGTFEDQRKLTVLP